MEIFLNSPIDIVVKAIYLLLHQEKLYFSSRYITLKTDNFVKHLALLFE